jgi:ankyrin repeat protein
MKRSIAFMGALLAAALTLGQGAQAQNTVQLVRAIKQDYAPGVKDLLGKGQDPNARDEQGQPVIVMALHEGSYKAATALIDSPRLKVNEANAQGENALMMAAWAGQMDIAQKLVSRGAVIDNKPGWTPLHYAATRGQLDMIRYLLGLNADIDAGSPNGSTPLMMAASYGSPESVRLLIESGADISRRNDLGMTALAFARQYQRPDAIGLLTQAERYRAQGRVWTRPVRSGASAPADP